MLFFLGGGGIENKFLCYHCKNLKIKFLYFCVSVVLQTVRLKVYYLHYRHRHPTAASDPAVSLGQRPIPEATEVTVELPSKFSATWEETACCRYGTVLCHIGLERL